MAVAIRATATIVIPEISRILILSTILDDSKRFNHKDVHTAEPEDAYTPRLLIKTQLNQQTINHAEHLQYIEILCT